MTYIDSDIYFIFQARVGSNRLPNKMILPFFKEKTIIEVILDRLVSAGIHKSKIIIATTNNPIDIPLVNILENNGYQVFVGEENNVLNRFIGTAKKYNAEKIFRICGDNPFLNVNFLFRMMEVSKNEKYDYVSFITAEGAPVIKTHFGFFCEYVNIKSLERISKLTVAPSYLEHVTNYIYTNPDQFKCYFLPIPKVLNECKWLRLTVDTSIDFKNAQFIYERVKNPDDIYEIIELSKKAKLYTSMIEQIKQNTK